MEKCPQLISDVLSSIERHDDSSDLHACLERCKTEEITSWYDDNGLDIMHHAVLSHNAISVGCLLSRGLFKPPHEPASFPYIHLACKTGQKSVVVLLLQERPFDNRPALFSYGEQESSTKLNGQSHQTQEKLQTPIDVAADAGHIECVKTILDFQQVKALFQTTLLGYRDKQCKVSRHESYIDMACRCNSPKALRLLLTENPSKADVERAVDFVVKNGRPECLDILLRCNIDPKSVFGGMNFFHVLFTYGILFDPSRYESLTLMTTVLLRHGHKPLAFRPSRTYPLYSLLSHAYSNEDYLKESAPYLISCILLLLQAGADPNFDEIKVEELACDEECETAFGREAFSSALHCLYNIVAIGAFQESKEVLDLVSKYVLKCSEILLHHSADPDYIGRLSNSSYGNSLHAFGLASRYLSSVKPTIKLLLRFGANPDAEVCNSFPLNTFCESIITNVTDMLPPTQDLVVDNAKVLNLSCLMTSMSRKSLVASGERLKHSLKSVTETRRKHILVKVLSKIEATTRCVWSLKKTCQRRVWILCGRDYRSVHTLPLPVSVKTEITNMV
ncbi:uncharacterized protein LOC121372512 [Gigantopelta aegis]|uniref:uncharacterized protein LOC121372512 n=1 Tax=Gigantopelta aegis TaxID=1735272 RepID=UPI001B88C2CE|nr:uncharacterized protein LOC121372512 [Gigantopelta aegis]XP_041354800.1 uncharacterized protein LOC121372512 [Gigantopelta aegis]